MANPREGSCLGIRYGQQEVEGSCLGIRYGHQEGGSGSKLSVSWIWIVFSGALLDVCGLEPEDSRGRPSA